MKENRAQVRISVRSPKHAVTLNVRDYQVTVRVRPMTAPAARLAGAVR